jgi:AcrR family transcriptional regulator
VARSTHRSILEAALALLDDGDAGFTYERLAERSGISRQTLYSHFPDRTDLLIAVVDHVRAELGADALMAPVYEAPTARDALRAMLDFHVVYTPQIVRPSRALEAQRALQPELSEAFERRRTGRRQLARHVVTRLSAEGCLDPRWTIDEATDLLSALTTAAFTSDLLDERHWTTDQLRARLLQVIDGALLATTNQPGTQPIDQQGAPT